MTSCTSFASGNSGSKPHPFGSFKHDGSFPASMISGSVTSRQLRNPIANESIELSDNEHDTSHDSTHIYMNLLDCSDYGAIKSTKFWSDDSSNLDVTSEFSSIHSDDPPAEICEDHRGGYVTELGLTCTDMSYTPRNITRCPIQVSLNHPHVHHKPPTAKPSSAVHSKVGPWLQQIPTNNSESLQPSITSSVSSNEVSLHSDISSQPSEPNIPSSSDMSAFMHQPLFLCGVTSRKLQSRKHSKLLKQLKKINKFFTKTSK